MQIQNIQKFNEVVEAAKAKAAGNSRWINAINKAVEGLMGSWIVTELADGLMVTTESGETYHANGVCQCKAFVEFGQPCKHRAAARLIEMYNEVATEATSPADEKTERAVRIVNIQNAWRERHPHQPIEFALLKRFGKSNLSMLDNDMLERVQVALKFNGVAPR